AQYRRQRKKQGIPVVSLVGYTNAGKSTLMNALSGANVLVEDKLFATLDPTTRRIYLPDGQNALLTDTVGFINKLPSMLVAAFRATLEEMEEADLLLHVVDITHKNAAEQAEVVEKQLADLELQSVPRIMVLNKIDLITTPEGKPLERDAVMRHVGEQFNLGGEAIVLVSAAKGWGMDRLREAIASTLATRRSQVSLPT
ncbi:MAG: GTPase HflX, partial [Chloroflexi bacterium]|nr:GTPase HflX [Chloroflexota bacterium]